MADSGRVAFLHHILSGLQNAGVTLTELFTHVLIGRQFNNPGDYLFRDIIANTRIFLSSLHVTDESSLATVRWAQDLLVAKYSNAVSQLSDQSEGWHFGAIHADPAQVRDFRLEEMGGQLQQRAPDLWLLIISLLGGLQPEGAGHKGKTLPSVDDPEDDELWAEVDGHVLGGEGGSETAPVASGATALSGGQRRESRRNMLTRIRATVIISVLMNSQDQRCNALQSLMGIFLHSCSAPEKLVKVISRMGLSISLSSIHRAVRSLAARSAENVAELGATGCVGYGIDNLDFKVPAGTPTVDRLPDGLIHLTTGTILRLDHGVTLDDLHCSRLIWDRSEMNPLASDPRPFDGQATMRRLLTLHPEREVPTGSLSRRGRFRAWYLLRTLFTHGPPSLAYFRDKIPDLEGVEMIPVTKLHQQPLQALDINLSTISGNLEAISAMFAQGGVGDPNEDLSDPDDSIVDISEFVTLVHGDLGTYEKVMSARRQRKQERTPYNRLQSVVFVMGLFHLKMAAADAIWRMLVGPDEARVDHTSFIHLVGQLRPNDSSRLINGAKFRDRHDLINHILTLLILDAWRVEVERRLSFKSLEELADAKPKLTDLEEIAETLAGEYVEGNSWHASWVRRRRTAEERDKVKENTARTLDYLLLYEELSYALNAGDIGRVETVFPIWIQLFRATGKHKYSMHMLRFMHAVWFVYPEGVRRAIRYNILVNPTGKPHAFRAMDWVVELLNLFIKVIYGGEGSNFTKDRVLLESILVLVFRNSHANFERNFCLPGLTDKHTAKDMRATFKQILDGYMSKYSPNKSKPGRGAKYTIPDQASHGMELLQEEWAAQRGPEEASSDDAVLTDAEARVELSADDISVDGIL